MELYAPQLATLVKEPPEGDAWLHELKYDGYRIGARLEGGEVQLLSRNNKDWTAHFPAVRDAVGALKAETALLDGEVAVVLADGRTSFQALQNAGGADGTLMYFVFDLLQLDGEDIGRLPLDERKQRLRRLLARAPKILRFADHIEGSGAQVLAAACKQGAEGIVSKRRDLPYQHGRVKTWLKTKCIQRQEVVIGGFTEPEGSRAGIGALLIGVYEGNALVFAGKVGTGFTQASARALRQQLEKLEQASAPFTPAPRGAAVRRAHWVRPQLVAEVAFTEWTTDGKIRHPSFQGLREDKAAKAVVRERPAALAGGADDATAAAATPAPRRRARATAGSPRSRSQTEAPASVAGVRITHPDRVLYPDAGLTKRQIAEFYAAIAERMLPHIADRPLTLVRCPDGIGDSCFFMKHASSWGPSELRRVKIRERKKVGEYLIADTPAAIVGLVQMNVLEVHTWNSTASRLEQPDRVVIDLDPGPQVAWPAIVDAARLVHTALHELKLKSFVKTTGGRGLHVVMPLTPDLGWDECLEFSRAVAEAIVRLSPRLYTTNFAKAGRDRQILIDYMRNNRTHTSVAAFSTRARPGAPVSTPLDWDELSPRLKSDAFTVRNLAKRLSQQRSDPWKAYWTTKQRLPSNVLERLAKI